MEMLASSCVVLLRQWTRGAARRHKDARSAEAVVAERPGHNLVALARRVLDSASKYKRSEADDGKRDNRYDQVRELVP